MTFKETAYTLWQEDKLIWQKLFVQAVLMSFV